MPTFKATLSDGRVVTFESDSQPDHDELLKAVDAFPKAEPLSAAWKGMESAAGGIAQGAAVAANIAQPQIPFGAVVPLQNMMRETDISPSAVIPRLQKDPLYRAGQVASEAGQLSPQQEASKVSRISHMAGASLPMALGAGAIPAFTLSSMGEGLDQDLQQAKAAGLDDNAAAKKALDQSLEKGAITAGVFTALPPLIRGPLEKYLVAKLGTTGFRRWLAGRGAAAIESGTLMGAQSGGEQAVEGQAPNKQTVDAALGGAAFGALMPWLREGRGVAPQSAAKPSPQPASAPPQEPTTQAAPADAQPAPPSDFQQRQKSPEEYARKIVEQHGDPSGYKIEHDSDSGEYWVVNANGDRIGDYYSSMAKAVKGVQSFSESFAKKDTLFDPQSAPQKSDLVQSAMEKTERGQPLSPDEERELKASQTANSPSGAWKGFTQPVLDEASAIINDVAKEGGHDVELVKGAADQNVDEPFANSLRAGGGLATIDRATGKILVDADYLPKWVEWMKGRGLSPERIKTAAKSLIEHEKIHLATKDADALSYWKTLTGIEKGIRRKSYTGKFRGSDVSDVNMGHEALRYRIQQLGSLPPWELAELAGREKWTLKSLDALESVVRGIRETLGTNASKEALAILGRVQANLGAVRATIGGQPAAKTRAQNVNFDDKDEVVRYAKSLSAESGVPHAVIDNPANRFKYGVVQESRAGREHNVIWKSSDAPEDSFPAARTRAKEDRTQDFGFKNLGEISSKKFAEPVPESQRTGYVGEMPASTSKQLDQHATDYLKEVSAKAQEELGQERRPDAPSFTKFSRFMRERKQSGLTDSHLHDLWSTAVNDWLAGRKKPGSEDWLVAPASGEELHNLVIAVGGKDSIWANARIPSAEDAAAASQSGIRTRYRSASPANPVGETKRSPQALREGVLDYLNKNLIEPVKDAAVLDRKTVTPEDMRYGGGSQGVGYKRFRAEDADAPNIGEQLTDNHRTKEDSPGATRRLSVLQDKQSGKVYLASTYKAKPEKLTPSEVPRKEGETAEQAYARYQREHGAEVRISDPGMAGRESRDLKSVLRHYRLLHSVMLDAPVRKFVQKFDSLKDYNERFGNEASQREGQHQSYDPETHGEPEGTAGFRTSSFQGPERRTMEAETGQTLGGLEEAARSPLSDSEAGGLHDYLLGHQGTLETPDNVQEAISALPDEILAQRRGGKLALEKGKRGALEGEPIRPGFTSQSVTALKKMARQATQDYLKWRAKTQADLRGRGLASEADAIPKELSTEQLMDAITSTIYENHTQGGGSREGFVNRTMGRAPQPEAPRLPAGSALPRPQEQSWPPSGKFPQVSSTERKPAPSDEQVAPSWIPPEVMSPEQQAELASRTETDPETGRPRSSPGAFPSDAERERIRKALQTPKDIGAIRYYPGHYKVRDELAARIAEQPPAARSRWKAAQDAKEEALGEFSKRIGQIRGASGRRSTQRDMKMTAEGAQNSAGLTGEQSRRSLQLVSDLVAGKGATEESKKLIRATPLSLISAGGIEDVPVPGKTKAIYDSKGNFSHRVPLTKKQWVYSKSKVLDQIANAQRAQVNAQELMKSKNWNDRRIGRKWLAAATDLEKVATYVRDVMPENPNVKSEDWSAAWTQIHDYTSAVKEELFNQMVREHEAGISTTDFGESYFPGLYEGEFFNGNSVTFGKESLLGSRYSGKKTFKDYFQAIAAAPFLPKSTDSADIVGHRVRAGMNGIAKPAWTEMWKDLKDPNSRKAIMASAVPKNPVMATDEMGNKHLVHSGWNPPSTDYELVTLSEGQQPVAVLKGYSSIARNMWARSSIQDSTVGASALYLSSMLKHGVILVGDTFHPTRLAQYALAAGGRKGLKGLRNRGYQGGQSALFYRPEDLKSAYDSGRITKESYDWANEKVSLHDKQGNPVVMTKQEILQQMVKGGLNAAKIGDALYREAVEKIPLVGPILQHKLGIGAMNNLIFNRLVPGMISESAVHNFERMRKAHPELSYDAMMRDVITDMNTYYGNMGKQGVFSHPMVRDLAQITFLAPMWQEGLIGKEARTLGRLTGISNLTGRRGVPQLGAVGSASLKGLAAYFVATQMLNLISRRQLTFQNKEEGHALDAWIPTNATGAGFWLSPLSVFAEKSHDLLRLGETKPKVWDAIVQMGENTLGPVGKAALVGISKRTPMGEYPTTTAGVLKSAGSQLLPVPISLGKPLQYAASQLGVGQKPEPGAMTRQAIASLGIKTEAAKDVGAQMQNQATKFARDNHLISDAAQIVPTDEPSYAKLRHSLKIGDANYALKILQQLRKTHTDDQIVKAMSMWARRPFTGSWKGESMWMNTMSDSQIADYHQALQDKFVQLANFEDFFLKTMNQPISGSTSSR